MDADVDIGHADIFWDIIEDMVLIISDGYELSDTFCR
jgi:hypothetical protein